MKKLPKNFEFKSQGHYDWTAILTPEGCILEEGTDFNCKTQTMVMLIRKQAKKDGKEVEITKCDGGVAVRVTGKVAVTAAK